MDFPPSCPSSLRLYSLLSVWPGKASVLYNTRQKTHRANPMHKNCLHGCRPYSAQNLTWLLLFTQTFDTLQTYISLLPWISQLKEYSFTPVVPQIQRSASKKTTPPATVFLFDSALLYYSLLITGKHMIIFVVLLKVNLLRGNLVIYI